MGSKQTEEPKLAAICKLLEEKDPLWLETITPGQTYRIQADDNDGDPNIGWVTIMVKSNGNVVVKLDKEECAFRYSPEGDKNQRIRNALLIMAEAIRLGTLSAQDKTTREKSGKLRKIHKFLDCLPWPAILSGGKSFTVQSDASNNQLPVFFHEDAYMTINYSAARFRSRFGGGRNPNLYIAMMILAVAIKLDTTQN